MLFSNSQCSLIVLTFLCARTIAFQLIHAERVLLNCSHAAPHIHICIAAECRIEKKSMISILSARTDIQVQGQHSSWNRWQRGTHGYVRFKFDPHIILDLLRIFGINGTTNYFDREFLVNKLIIDLLPSHVCIFNKFYKNQKSNLS